MANVIQYSLIAAHLDHGISEHPQKVVESLGCNILKWESWEIADSVVMELDRLPDPLPGFIRELDPNWKFAGL